MVGGGDSALEAAIQLACESSATVAISYRAPEFGRCREANRSRLAELVAAGKLRALMSSQVTAIEPDGVRLDAGGHGVRLPNDFVVVAIGGELPTEFLQKAGVSMRRYHGEAPGARHDHEHGVPHPRLATADEQALHRRLVALRILYAVAGLSLLAFLCWKAFFHWDGARYYPLPFAERTAQPMAELHAQLKSSSTYWHNVGWFATAFMLSNFLYAVRKRARWLTRLGHIKGWLDFHVFVGLMSPAVIIFHAAFQAKNPYATSTAWALLVVVCTGVIGRYIYGVVPAHGGRADEFEDLAASFERLRAWAEPVLAGQGSAGVRLLARATAPVHAGSLLAVFVRLPVEAVGLRLRLRWLRGRFRDRAGYLELREALVRLARLRWQLRFYGALKRLLRGWRLFHATLAVFLVITLTAHIGIFVFFMYFLRTGP